MTGSPSRTARTRAFWRRLLHRLPGRRSLTAEQREALSLPPMSRTMQAFSVVAFVLLAALLVAFAAWNPFRLSFLPGGGPGPASPPAEAAGSQAATAYQCPMHPQVVESSPGRCPICGMQLVATRKAGAATSGGRKILYWYAPMDPTYIRSEPGVSPMGMKLVPKYAAEGGAAEDGTIRIDPVQVQNIGVVTTPVKRADIARQSRTVGILDFNADDITWVNVKFEGWIEKVHVNYVGQHVRPGEPLFEIYSPELVTTQEEYLRALDYAASLAGSGRSEPRSQADSLVQSTRERLAYWDITDAQIDELKRTRQVMRRLTVTSPAEGVIAEVMSQALEGMYVKPGMNLYKIADLATIWVHANIYEIDIPWIRAGQPALVSFRNAPEESFRGKVLFLYPEVSRDTRTLKICVEVPNPQQRLRAGMYADVVVEGPSIPDAVVAPQSAIIRSGRRNIAFVALGEGRFQPREVELGVQGEADHVQILKGLAPGEEVVIQAQFMLDSESRIQEAIAQYRDRLTPRPDGGSPPTEPREQP